MVSSGARLSRTRGEVVFDVEADVSVLLRFGDVRKVPKRGWITQALLTGHVELAQDLECLVVPEPVSRLGFTSEFRVPCWIFDILFSAMTVWRDVPPLVEFRPLMTHCPSCGCELKVSKTRIRMVSTLHVGQFRAREVFLSSKSCSPWSMHL